MSSPANVGHGRGTASPATARRATARPTTERIPSIDVLRGFAVLGILIVNMQGFARISTAYVNPVSAGGFEGGEVWFWSIVYLFADTKFISIFSILFGAGMAMMSDRMAARGAPGTGLHYRRQFWLLLIGLVHAYLIWHGDILVAYALCGFILYPLRNLGPRRLLWVGVCAVAFVVPLWGLFGMSIAVLAAGGPGAGGRRSGARRRRRWTRKSRPSAVPWAGQVQAARTDRADASDNRFPGLLPVAGRWTHAGGDGLVSAGCPGRVPLNRLLPPHGRHRSGGRTAPRRRWSRLQAASTTSLSKKTHVPGDTVQLCRLGGRLPRVSRAGHAGRAVAAGSRACSGGWPRRDVWRSRTTSPRA